MRIARVAMIALAGLVCAWFVIGIRQAHELNTAAAIISHRGPLGAGQARRAAELLDAAATLDPSQEVDVLRGRLALAQGNPRRATQILSGVTRREPSDLEAWIWLARSSADSRISFYTALIAIRSLLPPVPPPR